MAKKQLSARDRINASLPVKKSKTAAKSASRPATKKTAGARGTPKKSPANTLGRTQNDVEFRQDHLSAAAEFIRKVGGVEHARSLLDAVKSQNAASPQQREGM